MTAAAAPSDRLRRPDAAIATRHRGRTWRRRFGGLTAHRRLADNQILDLVAGERLVFDQTLGERFEIGTLGIENLAALPT